MTLGHVQSAQGHGWEVAVGEKTYWFGRGLGGRLLGAFSSVIDLLDAFYQGNAVGLIPGQLGAMYFVPTLLVPLLLITHVLTFRILLKNPK